MITINTWGDRFRSDLTQISDFLITGNYDVIAWQELRANSAYARDVPGILENGGLGAYASTQTGDTGFTYRLDGTAGGVNGSGTQGNRFSYLTLDAQNMMPQTTLASVHFDYADSSTGRIGEAKNILNWTAGIDGPVIVVGDFNAGDVSERGLHHVDQQKLLLRNYLRSNNSFYYQLLTQYAVDRTQLDTFITENRGKTLANSDIPDSMFVDETYPVAGNTPVTMNILKKQFIMLQREDEREQFAPHPLKDGSTTWPSAGEDATNTWPSWDRVRIDHFMASRPYGKWWQLVDDPANQYVGTIDEVAYANDGRTPLTDHEVVAHDIKWVGPAIEKYTDSSDAERNRLVWGEAAAVFDDKDKVFYLTRNNMRTDVYLGQVSDDNGIPTLTGLTLDEKKTLLDCLSTDSRFQQAILEYCIDDHSFIGETLITDGGIVIVDEDAALGGAAAALHLSNGTLRIAGTTMTSLDREVVLEGTGGGLDIASAGNSVTLARTISGNGALTKTGLGELDLTGTNTYTGETLIAVGLLSVNGSIASSSLTTILDGGTLGGIGTIGDLRVSKGGTLAPGNSIGTLHVDGDVTFDEGSTYQVEVDEYGETDRLIATGTIQIDGGRLYFMPSTGNYLPYTEYEILSAAGGITGSFASIGSSAAFLLPHLTYGEYGVSMLLTRNDVFFSEVATTRNARSVARAVDELAAGNAVYDGIVTLDAASADAGFRQLSGELYPSIVGAFADDSRFARDVVTDRMARLPAVGFEKAEWQSWIQAYGNWGRSKAEGIADLTHNSGGVLFGFDTLAGANSRLGFMAGYGATSFSSRGYSASADANSFIFGVYGATALDRLRLTYGSNLAISKVDTSRNVAFGGFSDQLSADVDVNTAQIFGEAAYAFRLPGGTIEPFAGLAHVHARSGSFTEQGGSAALSGDAMRYDATFVSFGLRASTEMMLGTTPMRLNAEAGWRHAFTNRPETSLTFAGGLPFSVEGAPVNLDTAFLKAGVQFELQQNATVSLDYSGGLSADGGNHGLNASLKLAF
ncbi:autotransporter domain-containing protein [Aquibium carbonis]|nr:autotransporter domain-containing protein [Aquibium carbonis]